MRDHPGSPAGATVNGKLVLTTRLLMDGGMTQEDAEKTMKRLRDAESGQKAIDTEALRDQFAMNAPPVPEWFTVHDLPAGVAMGGTPGVTNTYFYTQRAEHETPAAREERRYFAWRWHYADEMMRTREGK